MILIEFEFFYRVAQGTKSQTIKSIAYTHGIKVDKTLIGVFEEELLDRISKGGRFVCYQFVAEGLFSVFIIKCSCQNFIIFAKNVIVMHQIQFEAISNVQKQ